MSSISIHFDGDITSNHQVSLRTLAKSLTHLQKAIDRAYLEEKNGGLQKYARMREEDYRAVELLVQEPLPGGYILNFFQRDGGLGTIIDRVGDTLRRAIESPFNNGLDEMNTISDILERKKIQIESELITPREVSDILENPDPLVVRKYGDRAIVREMDQLLALIRNEQAGDSTFEITLTGSRTFMFEFNRESAQRFHSLVSKKQLGEPIIYNAQLSSLDRYNKKGKVKIIETGKIANLHFVNEISLEQTMNFFIENEPMEFYGAPLIEYGAFDPNAGDIYFIGLTNE